VASDRARILGALVAVTVTIAAVAIVTSMGESREVTGIVTDADGMPIEGATVRIQTTETATLTDHSGRFSIPVPGPGEGVILTAWAEGYYIVGGEEHRAGDDVPLTLRPLPAADYPDYEWIPHDPGEDLYLWLSNRTRILPPDDAWQFTRLAEPPLFNWPFELPEDSWLFDWFADPSMFNRHLETRMVSRSLDPVFMSRSSAEILLPGGGGEQACAGCHSRELAGTDVDLPVDQWLLDAHSYTATNPLFVTMYLGTGWRSGPPIGYRLDNPDSFGNCAACHTPMASVDDPHSVDPTAVTGVAAEGIGCDFCHKVWDVHIDDETGLPNPDRPGVLSYEFRRPPPWQAFFAGPYDDVAPGEDTYLPLYSESEYCAPCHYGVFEGTVVFDSYGEWLRSPYADPGTGQTCQDCHMPPTGATVFAAPAEGGLERDPDTIPGHLMPGASDVELLQNAVTLSVDAFIEGVALTVTVEIINDRTGHHVPTDSPLRHMILLVEATGPDGGLTLLNGEVVPDWGGVGDPTDGRYAGSPGTAYAKILEDLATGAWPTGAHWNPTRIRSDNRIPAMGSDTTVYRFADPGTGGADVEVTLLFRRAFIDLADQKGWEIDDIIMETASISIP